MNRKERSGTPLLKLMLDQIEPRSGKVLGREHLPVGADAGLIYFDRGDVLWSRLRPDLAKAIVADEPGVGSPELVRLVVSPQRLDAAFLAHHLRSPEFVSYAQAFASGTTRPRLSIALLQRYALPLPPLPEQRRIVALLDSIERLADKHNALMAVLEKASRALLVSVVGEPVTWTASARVQPLRNLVRPPADGMHLVAEELRPLVAGLRPLQPVDLLKNSVTAYPVQEPAELDRQNRTDVLADAGAILVATEFPSTWNRLPVSFSAAQSRLGTGIRALLPARSDIPAAYLADVLRAASDRILVRARSTSRGLFRLDLESLLQMPIPLPNAEQLNCLNRYREATSKIVSDARRLCDLIRDAKDALARRAFSGGLSKHI